MNRQKRSGAALRRLLLGTALLTSGAVLHRTVAAPQKAEPQTLEGIVSDAACGAKHKSAIAVACIKTCVDKGSNYSLLTDDDKVYELAAKDAERVKLAALANVRAKVTGTVNGLKVVVSKVEEPAFMNYNAGG
jgi:hypothetical protein